MYGLRGLDDPSTLLETTISDAQEKIRAAGWWGLAIMIGVGFLVFRPRRR